MAPLIALISFIARMVHCMYYDREIPTAGRLVFIIVMVYKQKKGSLAMHCE